MKSAGLSKVSNDTRGWKLLMIQISTVNVLRNKWTPSITE